MEKDKPLGKVINNGHLYLSVRETNGILRSCGWTEEPLDKNQYFFRFDESAKMFADDEGVEEWYQVIDYIAK